MGGRVVGDDELTVLLDFDGTLAERPGMWSQTLLDVLDDVAPAHVATIETLRVSLSVGFPWHEPESSHLDLCEAELWWERIGEILQPTITSAGVEGGGVREVVEAFRRHYCDASRFHLFPDTLPALERLQEEGVRRVVVSNHVPELEEIVAALGLSRVVDEVFTSALTGFEKPHPEAFRIAVGKSDVRNFWMIGDNPVADCKGAEEAGIRSILVRHPPDHLTLREAVDFVLGGR